MIYYCMATCRLVVAPAVGAGLAAGVEAARVRVAEVLARELAARHERVAGVTCDNAVLQVKIILLVKHGFTLISLFRRQFLERLGTTQP